MFIADLSHIRSERQLKNNERIAEILTHSETFTEADLKPFLNFKSVDRLSSLLKMSRESIYERCREDYEFALTFAHGCSIASSRQGSKDEVFVLGEINEFTKKLGIFVKTLNNRDLRPTKDGRLLSKEEFKDSGVSKLDCLKSLDGEISGKVQGYIFAKLVFGGGGHQDNVFHEAVQFAEWARKFGVKDKKYVILIDTDQVRSYNQIKTQYDSDNVWIVNHVEFQQRLEAYEQAATGPVLHHK